MLNKYKKIVENYNGDKMKEFSEKRFLKFYEFLKKIEKTIDSCNRIDHYDSIKYWVSNKLFDRNFEMNPHMMGLKDVEYYNIKKLYSERITIKLYSCAERLGLLDDHVLTVFDVNHMRCDEFSTDTMTTIAN